MAAIAAVAVLSASGAPTVAPDNALQFDGAAPPSGDFVTFGAAPALNASQFTLETWFMRTGNGDTTTTGGGGLATIVPLIAKGRGEVDANDNRDTNYILGIDDATDTLAADFEDTTTPVGTNNNHPVLGTTVITNNVWHHAAATYNGTTWKLYLDGKLDRSLNVGAFTPRFDSIQHSSVGSALTSAGAADGTFMGVLDEARIWNVARTGAEIRANKNQEILGPTANLRGRWGLDEGSPATTVADSSGNGLTGTLTNGPTWVAGYTFPTDATPPAAVQGLSAVPQPTTATLTWTANAESDLAGYNVYRSTTSPVDTSGTPLNGADLVSPAATPSFNDTGLTTGQTYYYAVVAVDGSNNASTSTETSVLTGQAALQLNSASSQYVRMGTVGANTDKLNASQFTLETWFYRTGTGATTTTSSPTGLGLQTAIPLIAKGRGEAEYSNLDFNYFFGIDDATDRLAADFEDSTTVNPNPNNHSIIANTTITDNVWHHAAATYDGQTWKLYLDGRLDASLTLTQPFAPRSDSIQRTALASALTSTGTAAGFFQGRIDEARIWNVARTGAQIRASKNQELTNGTGLFGRWGLGEGTGTSAGDSTSSPLNGTLVNTPAWIAGYGFAQDASAPADPTGLNATAGDGQVDLSWNANGESDLAGYNVYRDTSSPVSTAGTPLNGADLVSPSLTPSFNDATAVNGQTYYYVIKAVDGSNNASGASNEASATPLPTGSKGLRFDGTNDHVTFGQATTTLGATEFTLETWFRRSGAGVGTSTGNGGVTAVPLITKGRAEMETPANLNMNYFLGIDATSGVLVADFEDDSGGDNHPVSGQTQINPDNTWHHAAATYDGTTWRLYLDGKLEKKQGEVGTPEDTSVQHAALGSALDSTPVAAGFFAGDLDEARIWNVARTGAQIRANKDTEAPSPTSGLRGHWHLDDGAPATTAADSSGQGVTGTLTNGPTWVTGYGFAQDTTAPADPTGLNATAGDGTVDLTWNANGESDLAGYNLYRDTSSPASTSGTPVNGGDLITTNSYTDTGLTNGQVYYYVVKAVDTADNTSGVSNEASDTPQPGDPVLVGAGDIADCTRTQDSDTGDLIEAIPGSVFTIGDNAYQNGLASEFDCYDAAWGAFKDRTRPTIGNHDFGNGTNPGAPNYFDYFNGAGDQNGLVAGDRALGYYSYDISGNGVTWHVVVLNSECEPSTGYWLPGGCTANSTQAQWLGTDLQNASTNNIIAMWHKPRWSSAGSHGHMDALYQVLYDNGVDILLGGHWHNYERLGPTDPDGNLDTSYGIRNFTIGTGGAPLSGFGTTATTSEVRESNTYGVMKFTLHASSYDWQFIPIAGQSFTDFNSVTQTVHGPPPDTTNPTVTIVSAVPSSLGPSDTSTDLTWNANENGTYSVRVGGTDCSNGTQVASGPYTTSPANVVTNILASQLAEGANTVRVCVTDGSTNTGSDTIVVTKSTVPLANALSFDGTNDYVTFGQATSTLGATEFTLETWFRRSGAGAGADTGSGGIPDAIPLITKGRHENDTPANVNMNYFLGIDLSSGVLVGDFEDDSGGDNHPVSGTTPIAADNTWHHAAATYDGTTWRLYLDGKLEKKQGETGTPEDTSIQHAALGTSLDSSVVEAPEGFFAGTLDEARIWNVARTGAQIRANKDTDSPSPASGLLGQWHLDEGAPSTIAGDSSGNNVTGTLTNGPTWVAGYGFPQDTSAPADPTGLNATAGDSQVDLTWNANGEPDVAGYNVFRSTASPVTMSDTLVNGQDLVDGTSFADTTAVNGTNYYYVIEAVDRSNNGSGLSNETSATPVQGDPVFVGAGDIADCARTQDTATAALVSAIPGQVWTAGDNVYQTGTAAEYANCYDPTWGPFKDRTRPAIGNHDLGNSQTRGADFYYDYFNGVNMDDGSAGPRDLGYYSYDVSGNGVTWHIVVLNSECEASTGYWLPGGCAANSTQEDWLQTDLANASTNNIIAIWHKPRFSSTGSYAHMQALWQALYDGGVDIALAGHEHNYERFTQMNAAGAADLTYGVRAFTVGTGGAALSSTSSFLSTSQVFNGSTYGVMKFTLHANSYDWQFIPIASQSGTFSDSGSTAVHGPPPDVIPPTVDVVSAVPSTVGASGSTNITWNANENGTYSVRVGGTTCSNGTQVASGFYTTSPANVVTNILASQLAEGANTVRACVTDGGPNTGSDTIVVTKDSLAPTVDVVSAVPSTVGASGSTNVTWNATENGTYSIRVGGTDCATGTQLASGSYTTSPANVVTNVLASALSEGANTIRACVTDSQSNTGSDTIVVTKDGVAPVVDVISAVPSTVGGSGSTDVTWNADENGTYSVRVGGTTCSNGTQVASGSYTTSPANVVTNILASQLAEGANTVRACVTDAAANAGSDTIAVTKDSTAPSVTIVSVVPNPVQQSDTSTNVTWNANENGTYSVRVGGTDCSTGTQVASGSYTTSPANVVTNVLASNLVIGSNTVRVCVTDGLTNTGSASTTVTKNGPTPVFRSASSATNGATGSITILKPAGVVLNDVLLATIDVIAAPTITPPLGWTLIRSDVSGTGTTAVRQSLYYHAAGLAEPAMYTFTFATAHGASGAILAYSGVDTTTPVEASSGATSATASLAAPSLTTGGANRMIVGLFGQNGQRSITPPAGMTERHELSLTVPAGEKVTSESTDVVQTATGATGVKTATSNGTGRGVAQLVALVPGSGSAPGPNPPVIDSVVINQSSPTTNQVLTATITSHDPDPGDVVTYSYQWKKNGSNVGTGATLDLSVALNGDEGDSITLQVTGSDGANISAPVTSAPVIVVNSPPSATVGLNTASPTTNQVLTATATKADPDAADTVMLTYVWKKNGNIMQTTGPTATLTDTYDLSVLGNGDDTDVITVEVTPNDGTVDGSLVSASATVGTPAGIVFRSAATATNNGTSIAVNTPTGVVSGDVLVAQIVSASSAAVTAPAGWTLIRSDVNTFSASVYRQSLYYHVAGGSEPSSYAWTFAVAHGATGVILAYSGVSNTTPIDVHGATIGTTSVTGVVAPSIMTTLANTRLLGFYSMNGGRTFTSPIGMTERSDIAETAVAGNKVTGESADELWAAIGATAARTSTANVAGWGIGALVALRPGP